MLHSEMNIQWSFYKIDGLSLFNFDYLTAGEETWRQPHKNFESNIEQVLATTSHETPTVWPLASHHENYTG